MAKEKYKPLSFSTTMRNPNRIADFLKCLIPFEGMLLTKDVIGNVVRKVIREKIYRPNYIGKKLELSDIYQSEDEYFSEDQLEDIISHSPQKHKESGLDAGWPSRFDTWYKLPMEFGFVKYAMDSKIEISATGHMLVDAVNETPINEQKIQNIFLNSLVKYQTHNPYRKNKSDNVPLVLLLQVLQMLHDNDSDSTGVFRQELGFFICWTNNDAKALYDTIMMFREKYSFRHYTDELVYDECLRIMHYTSVKDKNYIKKEKVTGEAIDEYIRKMRSTGLISLRGNGRFIDFNKLEIKKIEYVLNEYATYTLFSNKTAYFEYMGNIDPTIMEIQTDESVDLDYIRQKTLLEYAKKYDKQSIFIELRNVCYKKESKDPVFRVISEPARFEFLTSISLLQNFKEIKVLPNYAIDDGGPPTCTASGGKADIVCTDGNSQELVEVTLMCGRQQVNNEMLPISRHLSEAKKDNENTIAIFVAPRIHEDVRRYIGFIKFTEELEIKAFDINEFMDELNNYASFRNMISDL